MLVLASGCPSVGVDSGQGQGQLPTVDGPTVEFDPANGILPFPNNLVLDPTTGKVNIPAPACESPTSMAVRTGVLNTLDGFGTFEAGMVVTFTDEVDEATLTGKIVMYQRAKGATANDPLTATKVPLKLIKGTTLRFDPAACATPASINAVTVVPMVPLDQKSTYVIAVLKGVQTATAAPFIPSFTWALARQTAEPVTLDASGNVTVNNTPLDPSGDANHNGIPDLTEIQGLDLLWKAHAKGLAFLDGTGAITSRDDVLVAWEVTTQTTTDPLDPAIAGSPAATLDTTALASPNSLTCDIDTLGSTACPNGFHRSAIPWSQCPVGDSGTQCFLKIALGGAACGGACNPVGTGAGTIYGTGNGICSQTGCITVGDILGAALVTKNYQVNTPNPLATGAPIPGPWTDPLHPTSQGSMVVQVLIFVPDPGIVGAPPVGGRPTVIFGHGLGQSKNNLFAIGPQLAASPGHFASAAIDFRAHGSRAVQISNDAGLGCAGTPDPTVDHQCFEPIISGNLAVLRDNFRQSVLDVQRLVLALKACGAAGCQSLNSVGNLTVDPTKILYTGQSLGGILGSAVTSVAADIHAAVLNVPGVGLFDILETTPTLDIRCGLVDSLIDAGVLVGTKWNGSDTAPTGLCVDEAWLTQPGYGQFSGVARWVIDSADPANYTAKLAPKKFVIQEVIGDQVVPNTATDNEGALVGLTPAAADLYLPVCLGGTAVGTACANDSTCPGSKCGADPTSTIGTSTTWVRYTNLPANAGIGFPGNTFAHSSLLKPANSGNDGLLGLARMQTDAITFLIFNQ